MSASDLLMFRDLRYLCDRGSGEASNLQGTAPTVLSHACLVRVSSQLSMSGTDK